MRSRWQSLGRSTEPLPQASEGNGSQSPFRCYGMLHWHEKHRPKLSLARAKLTLGLPLNVLPPSGIPYLDILPPFLVLL